MNRKRQKWTPGMYEGKSPADVAATVGTAAPTLRSLDHFTPRSMRGFDPKLGALKSDGTPMQALNRRTS